MIQDKEHPALLVYMLIFFSLLAVVGYLMLVNTTDPSLLSESSVDLKIPSYQNMFGSSQ